MVLLAQNLALRRDLNARQTLTAIHDKSRAWLGLGSSLASLYQQTKLRAAAWGVLAVTAYLTGISVLHITISSLLDVVPLIALL